MLHWKCPLTVVAMYLIKKHLNHNANLIHPFHPVALQSLFKPWPPKYIHSILWHFSQQLCLGLPNTSIPLYGTTAHSQVLASQIHPFHCVALQSIFKPWPPKYIHSIVWHFSPQSSPGLPNTSIPFYGTTAHSQALASQVHASIHTKFYISTNSIAVHFYSCVYKVYLLLCH